MVSHGRGIRCRLGIHRWRDVRGWPVGHGYVGFGGWTPIYTCTRCGESKRWKLRPGSLF